MFSSLSFFAALKVLPLADATLTEIKLDAAESGLATQVTQLEIGESTVISSGKGPPKTVIRTDYAFARTDCEYRF